EPRPGRQPRARRAPASSLRGEDRQDPLRHPAARAGGAAPFHGRGVGLQAAVPLLLRLSGRARRGGAQRPARGVLALRLVRRARRAPAHPGPARREHAQAQHPALEGQRERLRRLVDVALRRAPRTAREGDRAAPRGRARRALAHARRARVRSRLGNRARSPDAGRELRHAARGGRFAPAGPAAVVQRGAGRGLVGELVDQRVSPEEEIASGYLDVWGRQREIALETRAALAKALGAPARGRPARIASGRCRQPEILEEGGRVWGFMVQLYALRSERNWGIGDFTDLLRLVETSARLGAALVGVNPLHAALSSPYSPSSRHALNAVYIDVEAIPELAACEAAQRLLASTSFGKRLKALREADLVDYEGVRKAKAQVLELLFASLGAERRKAFAAFRKTLPKGARDYALYEA